MRFGDCWKLDNLEGGLPECLAEVAEGGAALGQQQGAHRLLHLLHPGQGAEEGVLGDEGAQLQVPVQYTIVLYCPVQSCT